VHNPRLSVAVEGARAADAEHLLAALAAPVGQDLVTLSVASLTIGPVAMLADESLGTISGALFGLTSPAQPSEHAFAEPNHFGPNAFVPRVALS
jgi:hypothetical protein